MASRAMPFKTAQDRAALSTRQRRVSQRHRTVLCLIDAKCRTAEAGRMALLAGVPESGFDGLQSRGLIALPPLAPPRAAPAAAEPADVPADVEALDVDRPLPGFDHLNASPDSSLPPSRTLQPESTVSADLMLDDLRAADPWPVSRDADADAPDDAVAEARELMANAVRTQAPVAGSLTLLRRRRAGSRADLPALFGAVEVGLNQPHRSLVAAQMLQRVRALFGEHIGSKFSPA